MLLIILLIGLGWASLFGFFLIVVALYRRMDSGSDF